MISLCLRFPKIRDHWESIPLEVKVEVEVEVEVAA